MSQFGDALSSALAQAMDPETGMKRDFAKSVLQDKELDVITRKSEVVEGIEQKLAAAQQRKAKPAVIGAYEKLLSQLNR